MSTVTPHHHQSTYVPGWDGSSDDTHTNSNANMLGTAAVARKRYPHDEQGREPTEQMFENNTPHPSHVSPPPAPPQHNDADTNDRNVQPVSEQTHIIRQRLGLNARAPIHEDHDDIAHNELLWSRVKITLKEPFAEFWGTFIMVFFGNGSVAQVILSTGLRSAPGGNGYGAYNAISWGWALGVLLGIYISGDAGGYLNPAITFAQCLFRGLPWRRFPMYLVAQFLGGFLASGVVYGYYWYAIENFEGPGIRSLPPTTTATAAIFCTYPQPFMTTNAQFWAEVVETCVLMFCVLALQDMSNAGPVGHIKVLPLGLFFVIWGLGACFGYETGYAMNLARDLGPRLMSYAVGYGPGVWTAGNYYFWVPIVAPFVGCSFGGFLYDVFIYTGQSPVNTPWLGLKRIVMFPVSFVSPEKRGKNGGGGWKTKNEIDQKYTPALV